MAAPNEGPAPKPRKYNPHIKTIKNHLHDHALKNGEVIYFHRLKRNNQGKAIGCAVGCGESTNTLFRLRSVNFNTSLPQAIMSGPTPSSSAGCPHLSLWTLARRWRDLSWRYCVRSRGNRARAQQMKSLTTRSQAMSWSCRRRGSPPCTPRRANASTCISDSVVRGKRSTWQRKVCLLDA